MSMSLLSDFCSWSPVMRFPAMMFQIKQPVSEDEKLNGKYIRRAPGLWELQHETLVQKAYYVKLGHYFILITLYCVAILTMHFAGGQ